MGGVAERKLAAIMVADVAGFSRLMERDESHTFARLSRLRDEVIRPKVGAHGGRIVKTTGDGFLAEFSSATAALKCGVEIQRTVMSLEAEKTEEDRIRLRIGINVGDIIVDGSDVAGDGVNVAARLEWIAPPDGLCVSASVREQIRDDIGIVFQDLGEQQLKNIARPIRAYAVTPSGDTPARAASSAAAGIRPALPDMPSIAVLPFANFSRDDENEYFADGLSEELLNVLAKIRGLRVASRTSAFSFKGKNVDIATIAQKLNVASVLEGSIRRSGNRVRITAQLIHVATDSHLWSETYDRQLDDIFAVQDDIAQSIVKELRATLLGAPAERAGDASAAADVQRAAAGRSHSPEAFQLYLKGKFFGERLTQADTDKAIGLFQDALAIDSSFALAWAGLSRTHQIQAAYGFAPINEGYERARAAAQHALRLAPDLAEGHIEMGRIQVMHDWNWAAAEASIRRALEFAPGDGHALISAAELNRIVGRNHEALEMIMKAITCDPLSARTHRQAALIHLTMNRLDDAAAYFQLGLDLSPNTGLSRAFLAIVRLLQGRVEEGLAIAETEPHDVFRNLAYAMIYHALGRTEEARAAVQTLSDDFGWTAPYQVAEVYANWKEIEKAFEWLERAYAQRDPGIVNTASDLLLEPLHADPRWRPFLHRMHLA